MATSTSASHVLASHSHSHSHSNSSGAFFFGDYLPESLYHVVFSCLLNSEDTVVDASCLGNDSTSSSSSSSSSTLKSIQALLTASTVCKRWRSWILNNEALWKQAAQIRWKDKAQPLSPSKAKLKAQSDDSADCSDDDTSCWWRPLNDETWYDAFRRVESDARRVSITREELAATTWKFKFQVDHEMLFRRPEDPNPPRPAEWECVFTADSMFVSNVPHAPSTRRPLKWSWVVDSACEAADDAATRVVVGPYPPLKVSRREDWSWVLENQFVRITNPPSTALLL
ncbi:hypothetical protein NFJ02_06g125930 [Pycnococcus provasolii]